MNAKTRGEQNETAPIPEDWSTDASSQPSTSSERFTKIVYLTQGGMAKIYQAYDTEQGREVVLKEFKGGTLRATQEYEVLCAVGGENTGVVEAFCVCDEALVLEHIQGKSLREHLAQKKGAGARPDLSWIESVMFGILSAVEYIHQKGYAHLDLKPENIMLTEGGEIKIIDFGMAHLLGKPMGWGVEKGTYFYTAPECVLRKEHSAEITRRSADLYSLGAILFELLTYEQATGMGRFSFEKFYLSKGWQPLAAVRKDLAWQTIIENTMSQNPSFRWSLDRLKEELKICFNFEKLNVGSQSPQHRENKPTNNNMNSTPSKTSGSPMWLIGLLIVIMPWAVYHLFFSPGPGKNLSAQSQIPDKSKEHVLPEPLLKMRSILSKVTTLHRIRTKPHLKPVLHRKRTKPRFRRVLRLKRRKSRSKRVLHRKRITTRKPIRAVKRHQSSNQPASLKIQIHPPCELFAIGGGLPHFLGELAFGKTLIRSPGTHRFRCIADGGKFKHNFQVDLSSGEARIYQRIFKQGTLMILSSPTWTSVSMKKYGGLGRSGEPIRLYEGKYTLVLYKEANHNHSQKMSVLIQPGKTTRLKVTW